MITQAKKEKTSIKYAKFRRHLLDGFDHFDKELMHEIRDDISSLERAKVGLCSSVTYRLILANHQKNNVINPITKIDSKFYVIEISIIGHHDKSIKQISRGIARDLICEDFESNNLVSKIEKKENSSFVYKFELI